MRQIIIILMHGGILGNGVKIIKERIKGLFVVVLGIQEKMIYLKMVLVTSRRILKKIQ